MIPRAPTSTALILCLIPCFAACDAALTSARDGQGKDATASSSPDAGSSPPAGPAPAAGGGPEQPDTPVWINGTYLTCAWDDARSKDDIDVRCAAVDSQGRFVDASTAEVTWRTRGTAALTTTETIAPAASGRVEAVLGGIGYDAILRSEVVATLSSGKDHVLDVAASLPSVLSGLKAEGQRKVLTDCVSGGAVTDCLRTVAAVTLPEPLDPERALVDAGVREADGEPRSTSASATAELSAASGTQHRRVDVRVVWPQSAASIAKVTVRRKAGAVAPADCADGVEIGTKLPVDGTVLSDDTTDGYGGTFSYRACVTAIDGSVTVGGAASAAAQDLEPPPPLISFSAYAQIAGSVTVMLTYPTTSTGGVDTRDYHRVRVWRALSDSSVAAPACGAGTLVGDLTAFENGGDGFVDNTGMGNTQMFASYRACVEDRAGNLREKVIENISTAPGGVHRMFVTAGLMTGSGVAGVAYADNVCVAAAMGLGGTWKAVISDSSISAKQRLPSVTGKITDVLGNVLSNDGLWSSSLMGPNRDAAGVITSAPAGVWTGTNVDGSSAAENCANWTKDSGSGRAGLLGGTNGSWISLGSSADCSGARPIYCVEL